MSLVSSGINVNLPINTGKKFLYLFKIYTWPPFSVPEMGYRIWNETPASLDFRVIFWNVTFAVNFIIQDIWGTGVTFDEKFKFGNRFKIRGQEVGHFKVINNIGAIRLMK